MSYQPYGNQEFYSPQPPPARTNGKSIAALVLGILSIVIPYIGLLFGIIAIIFSAISFKEIRMGNEQGRGLAIAGLVCGIVGTILYAVIIVLIILAFVVFNLDPISNISNFSNI
ncbi:DUF4190 domain-containing protein [Paenibacillus monticola]|uniref:DUF4190 domain-containing protein n=1 Tax=Paenibacillus monticola TaxID=2666075 RepID=A0A7X2L2P3_9BACL|nr:DUF4190 domain-containing protein [Paenibacillus monticola]MRN54415.1 DUF4190 domain-containing protein [Paenibacillus monticola]